jgi:N-acetylneuraminic acid mutarotase
MMKRLMMSVILAFGLMGTTRAADAPTPLDSDGWRWETLECVGKPTGRHETSFGEIGGKFYLLGGREAQGRIERFDPATKTWDTMKAQSPLIHHFQPVNYDGKIWMLLAMTGGYPKEPPMTHIQIYDPVADVWTEGGEIPEARRRGGGGAVVYNDKIYVVGGITLGHTSGTNGWFDEYDPKTGQWKQLPDAPHIRDHFHAVVLDDKLYCIGGRVTGDHSPRPGGFFATVIPEIDVYDFKTAQWSVLDGEAALPNPSAAGGVVAMDDCIVYFGGETGETALNNCQVFDPKTKAWKALAPLNQGRHGSQAILYENRIYIAAGSPNKGGGKVDSIEMFSRQ